MIDKKFWQEIFYTLFKVSSLAWLFFCLAEIIRQGLINNYLNVNYFLIFGLLFFLCYLFFSGEKKD